MCTETNIREPGESAQRLPPRTMAPRKRVTGGVGKAIRPEILNPNPHWTTPAVCPDASTPRTHVTGATGEGGDIITCPNGSGPTHCVHDSLIAQIARATRARDWRRWGKPPGSPPHRNLIQKCNFHNIAPWTHAEP